MSMEFREQYCHVPPPVSSTSRRRRIYPVLRPNFITTIRALPFINSISLLAGTPSRIKIRGAILNQSVIDSVIQSFPGNRRDDFYFIEEELPRIQLE